MQHCQTSPWKPSYGPPRMMENIQTGHPELLVVWNIHFHKRLYEWMHHLSRNQNLTTNHSAPTTKWNTYPSMADHHHGLHCWITPVTRLWQPLGCCRPVQQSHHHYPMPHNHHSRTHSQPLPRTHVEKNRPPWMNHLGQRSSIHHKSHPRNMETARRQVIPQHHLPPSNRWRNRKS